MNSAADNSAKEYDKSYDAICPKDSVKTLHTVTYARVTCSRFRESVLWFACQKDACCQECREDYE